MGRDILFKCPQTGMNVQHWLAEDASDDHYKPVTCPACTRLHFIHNKTGELLGRRDEPRPPR
jgi:hypothetical protein